MLQLIAKLLEQIQCCIAKLNGQIQDGNEDTQTLLQQVVDSLTTVISALAKGESCDNPIFSKDCDTPAIIAQLEEINESLNNIEITAEQINLNADQINLNTEPVEDLLTQLNDFFLDTILACDDENVKKLKVDICNFSDFVPPVTTYNKVYTNTYSTTGSSQNVPIIANTYKSLTITCVQGTVSLLPSGSNLITIPAGMSITFTADNLIVNSFQMGLTSNTIVNVVGMMAE